MNSSFWPLFWRRFVAFLYPNRCPFCDRLIDADSTACAGCVSHLRRPQSVISLGAGQLAMPATAAFFYETVARRGLLRFKYQQAIQLGPYFAKQAQAALQALTQAEYAFDAILSVPRSPEKHGKYWHLGDLTTRFGKATGLPVLWKVLNRLSGKTPQHRLGAAERFENAKHLFALQADAQKLLAGKRLLLVDDVITTGSTMLACRDLLLNGGAKQVCGIAICYRELVCIESRIEEDNLLEIQLEQG